MERRSPRPIAATAQVGRAHGHPEAVASGSIARITPWVDDVVDRRGHDPRSAYVERYWLAVIGPTATWIVRRFADEFDRSPTGFAIDLDHTACTMGLSFNRGDHSPFGKALHRCVMFGVALPTAEGYAVRRRLPNVARRHLARLPVDVRDEHDEWSRVTANVDRRRIEEQLVAIGVPPETAARAGEFAARTS